MQYSVLLVEDDAQIREITHEATEQARAWGFR